MSSRNSSAEKTRDVGHQFEKRGEYLLDCAAITAVVAVSVVVIREGEAETKLMRMRMQGEKKQEIQPWLLGCSVVLHIILAE